MKKHLLPVLAIHCTALLLLISQGCAGPSSQDTRPVRKAVNSDAQYGGLFRLNFTEEVRSVFPHNLVDASAYNIMNQVYEGLIRIDRHTQQVKPVLAERYEINEDGTIYKFFLRPGVYFHEDQVFGSQKKRALTANDVAYCYSRLCEPGAYNQLYDFALDLIKGGRKHYEAVAKGQQAGDGPVGIRVVSERVIEIELEFPMPNFLSVLGHPCFWIFPKELYSYGHEVDNWSIGTGPFKLRTIKPNDVIIMERNLHYWKTDAQGNSLPYMDAVRCNFINSEEVQLSNFMNGNLDLLVQIPYDEASKLAADDSMGTAKNYRVLTSPGLRVEYYGFQHRSAIYGNELVRQAFNYAIDRNYLVNEVLNGFGTAATSGFVPDGMVGFEGRPGNRLSYNPDTARALLTAAGYPDGKNFPVVTLQLNDGNATALLVADEVQRMLNENLNLTVELAVLPRSRHYNTIENGTVGFWRDGWIADYPDPENFLKLFHGKLVPDDSVKSSYLNTMRFKDTEFDEAFEAALREPDRLKRTALFLKADQRIVDRAAVVPLYHEKWIWLTSHRVHNLTIGSLGELDLREVYIKEP